MLCAGEFLHATEVSSTAPLLILFVQSLTLHCFDPSRYWQRSAPRVTPVKACRRFFSRQASGAIHVKENVTLVVMRSQVAFIALVGLAAVAAAASVDAGDDAGAAGASRELLQSSADCNRSVPHCSGCEPRAGVA